MLKANTKFTEKGKFWMQSIPFFLFSSIVLFRNSRMARCKLFWIINFLLILAYFRAFYVIARLVNSTKRNLLMSISNSTHKAKQMLSASKSFYIVYISSAFVFFIFTDMHLILLMLIMMVQLILMNFFWLLPQQVKVI
jgi:hypothetical protein